MKILLFLARVFAALSLIPLTIGILLNIVNPGIMSSLARLLMQMNRIPDWANWLMLVGAVSILAVLFVPLFLRMKEK